MAANGDTKQEEEVQSRIPVAYLILGYENNRNAIIDSLRNAKSSVSSVYDANMPKVVSKIDWLEKEVFTARQRGVKFNVIAEITIDNISYCKELSNRYDELRHLYGIRGIFGVTDTQALVMVPSLPPIEERNIQFILSDSESVVSYKQLIFDMLWLRATPAKSRFDELEGKRTEKDIASDDGRGIPTTTHLESKDEIIDRIYSCKNCRNTFINVYEVADHKKITGHENFREYPVI